MTSEEKLITLGNLAYYDDKIKQYIEEHGGNGATYDLILGTEGDEAGKLVLVGNDGTRDVVSLPGNISQGNADNSLEVFDGVATQQYSMAIGTNDKTPIKGILGDIAANQIAVNNPLTGAIGSIAFGGGAETKSTGGQALGVLNTSGVTGYYWDEIDFTNKTITITSTRRASSLITPTAASGLDWQVGDTISLVNDNQYAACATITAISGNKITVDKLPFTSINYSSKLSVYTYVSPDDRTIFACYQKEEANFTISALNVSIVNKRWYPRNGVVELGWAGTAFGVENLVTGSGALVAGFNNWQAGNFGITGGRNNIGGYCGLTMGFNNSNNGWSSGVVGRAINNTGNYNLVGGLEINNTGSFNLAGGYNNKLLNSAGCNLITGENHEVSSGNNAVAGYKNILEAGNNAGFNGVFGHSHALKKGYNLVGGYQNKLEGELNIVGGDYHEISSNCNIVGGHDHTITGNYNGVFGYNNTVNKGFNIIGGSGHTITGESSIVCGDNNTVSATRSIVAGNANDASGASSVVTGDNNEAVGSYSIISGKSNDAHGMYSIINGNNNATTGNYNIINGANLRGGDGTSAASGNYCLIQGYDHRISHDCVFAFGGKHTSSGSYQTLLGYGAQPDSEAMFILANNDTNILTFGSSKTRSDIKTDIVTVEYLESYIAQMITTYDGTVEVE